MKQKKEWVTGAELARRVGVSRQRVYALISAGKIKRRKSDKKIDYDAALKIIDFGRQLDKNISDNDELKIADADFETLTEARKATESYRAKMAELDYLERRGELVKVSDVIETCEKIIITVKSKLLAIPAAKMGNAINAGNK